jgi:hypothetical protein
MSTAPRWLLLPKSCCAGYGVVGAGEQHPTTWHAPAQPRHVHLLQNIQLPLLGLPPSASVAPRLQLPPEAGRCAKHLLLKLLCDHPCVLGAKARAIFNKILAALYNQPAF